MNVEQIEGGDTVRVKDPESFLSYLSKKVADRDAIVNWVGPDKHGQFVGYASLTFQKRNGRGKEFTQRMHIRNLVIVKKSDKEKSK